MSTLSYLFIGLIAFISLGMYIVLKLLSPKRNSLAGYRTPRSMKSEDSFQASTRYSTKLFLQFGFSIILIRLILLIAGLDSFISDMISLGLYVLAPIFVIILTEQYLK